MPRVFYCIQTTVGRRRNFILGRLEEAGPGGVSEGSLGLHFKGLTDDDLAQYTDSHRIIFAKLTVRAPE
jgi:hypothetical protein